MIDAVKLIILIIINIFLSILSFIELYSFYLGVLRDGNPVAGL